MQTLTYLQPGMVILYGHEECLVEMVNECRARVRPLSRRVRSFKVSTGPQAGQTVTIEERAGTYNLSPNSELPILRRLPVQTSRKGAS